VRLERDLADGDELEIRNRRGAESLIYAGKDTPAGGTALVRLREGLRAEAGDRVFRLTSAAQMREAAQMPGRRVTADLSLRAVAGEPLTLRATDGENEVTVQGGETAAARTRPAQEEELRRKLSRTGDTLFVPGKIEIETEGAFVPVSEINRIRREALAALEEAREKAFAPDCGGEYEILPAELPRRSVPETAIVRTEEQARCARERGLRVVWDPEDWRADALERLLADLPEGDWLQIPRVCTEETLQGIRAMTEKHREKLGGVVLGSIGQLGIRWPVPYGAGSGIPVMNRQAAAFLLEAGCEFVTASPELTGKELEELTAGDPPILVTVFGRTQLMLLHHCPARTALGCTDGHRDCRMCDVHHPDALQGNVLEDGMGHRFPLLRQRLPEGCRIRLMNGLPTEWTDRKGIRNPQVELTTESREETERVLDALAAGIRTGLEATGGHWSRPVE
jgi:putative protease